MTGRKRTWDKSVEDTFPAINAPATARTTRSEVADGSDVPGTDPEEDVPDNDTPAERSPGDVPPDESAPQGNQQQRAR